MFWNEFDVRENAVELMRDIDARKAEFIDILLNAGVIPDLDALVDCYTFRAPQAARVLLEHGANPNMDWEGGESCVAFANAGLVYFGMNKASEVMVKEYMDTLKEFGGLYLDFLFTDVYYDDWQMQCCGEPFHVGDCIELLVEKDSGNSKWNCRFHEEHHYTLNRQYVLKGKVRELSAEIIRPPYDTEVYVDKLREHSELIPISYADGYAEIPKDCIERNALRENPIPDAGLVDTSRRMELPTKAEGYSRMYYVRMKDGHFDESEWIEE